MLSQPRVSRRVRSRERLSVCAHLRLGEGRGTDVALVPRCRGGSKRKREISLGVPCERAVNAVREKDSVTFSTTAARLALLDYDRSRRITNIVYAKKWKVLLQDRGNVVSAAGRCFLSRSSGMPSSDGRNLVPQLQLCFILLIAF